MALADAIVSLGYPGEGLSHEPTTALAVGAVYIVGKNGDHDPGVVMFAPEVYNSDTADDIWVGRTMSEAMTAGSGRIRIPAGKSKFLPGAWATLVAFNPSTSAGTVVWGVVYENRGALGPDLEGGHPGHGGAAARIVAVQNATSTVHTFTVRRKVSLTGVRAFSVSKNTSAGGSVLLHLKNAAGTSLLVAATFDLETLTNGVLETLSLTATSALLDLEPGDTVRAWVVSDNADMAEGDLAVSLITSLR